MSSTDQDQPRLVPDSSLPPGALRRWWDILWEFSATRGGIVFVIASVAVNLSNFVFHLVLSRLLGPAGYGALGALLNVTAVIGVPLAAVSVTVAQSVARRPDPADTPPLGRLLRLSAVAAVAGFGLWLAATPTIDRFFHLHSPGATIVLGLWLVPALPGAVLEGVVLGQRRFRVAGLGQVAGVLVRLAVGVVLVELGFGVIGGVAATAAAGSVVVAVYAVSLRSALGGEGRFAPRAGDALLSTIALGGAALLTSIDAWLARHFLAAHAAGLFTAAATAGNIALFLPGAITMVYFPRLAASRGRGPEARQALARATGLVAVLGLGSAAVMALVPGLVVDLLFGPAFAHASAAIGTVAAADAGIGIASCLIYYQVSRGSRLALAAWPTCLVAAVLAAAFHGSIETLALDMVAASGALVVGLGVPTLVQVLGSLAEDTASLPRQALLLDEPTLDLTMVVPFHNVGADRLADHLSRICETLAASGVDFEVVPVSDGSTDGSEHGVDRLPTERVRPIVLADNRGKGEALRIGLAVGRGRYLGFIDGDGDIPAGALASFVDLARRQQPDVVVGSKRHPDAKVDYPPLRRLYSTGYQVLIGALFGLRVRDTQTGVKLIRRDVVAEVLPRMVEKRFAFDLELLTVAHRLGYRQVAELPVTIGERFPSTISPRSEWRMLQDTLATLWRLRILHFYDPPLTAPGGATAAAGAGSNDRRWGEAPTTEPGDLAERLRNGERLRILVCNWRDLSHPHAGGAEVYTHRVARTWVAAGHEVTWFCAAVDGQPSLDAIDGIRIVRRGGRHTVYRQARRYWERQARGRFDLIIDEVNTRPFGAARWPGGTPTAALVHQVAKEVWFHEVWWPVAALGRFLVEPRWLRRLRSVPVVTVSASSAASLHQFGVDDVTVVPEGIDAVERPLVEREEHPTVVFVGRLARNKRPDHAVDAFRRVVSRLPDARLWIIGTGPMEASLRASAPAGVEFLGRVPEREKVKRLARAHCLVATSVREGWGLTVTEAAQVGTPAMAYDVDGLRDSVSASGGVLVPPQPEALAEALVDRLPRWTAEGPPAIQAEGVLPWAAVAEEVLSTACERVSARRRAAAAGEDVSVAWRRMLAPVAAACDRRAWSVVGIAALVALAPLSEAGATGWARDVAAVALACLAVAAIGTWAEALRWPLAHPGAGTSGREFPVARDGAGPARRQAWLPMAVVGVATAAAAQSWFAGAGVRTADRPPAVGAAWLHQLGAAFSASPAGAGRNFPVALQLPLGVTGNLVHVLGGTAALNERLWLTVLFAAVGVTMTRLLGVLGLGPMAAVVGGLVYAFSPYVVAMSGLDATYLAAMALVPALVAWVLVAARRRRLTAAHLAWMVPGALVLGLVAGSPPLLLGCGAAIVGGTVMVGLLHGRSAFGQSLRRTAIGAGVLTAASAYWAVPLGLALASTSMVSAAAHRSWRWAEARATLSNGFWLNTAWNWGNHAAYPYAAAFSHFPLVLWRYALPVVAFDALAVAGWRARTRHDQQRTRLLALSGSLALVVVLLSTGSRGPGAPLFGLLTALPYGWLLEDPGRFLFVAGAAYAVLVAMVVDHAWPGQGKRIGARLAERRSVVQVRPMEWLAPIGLCVALLVPAYPLVSGGPPALTSGGTTPGSVAQATTVPADACIGVPPPGGAAVTARSYRLCSLSGSSRLSG
ncbi:MAG: glycosyltransferase, partial [Acidimicrobiales bacterium]